MGTERIAIENVLDNVGSHEELEEQYDEVIAYHGTSHRFRDAIQEYGIIPGTDLLPMEGQKTDRPIVYFGPKTSEDESSMDNTYAEMYSDAASYANRAVETSVGGKPIILKCALPVDNLVPDDCERAELYDVETPYDSINTWATLGHEGTVSPEQILDSEVTANLSRPPENNGPYMKTQEYNKFEEALGVLEQDWDVLERIGDKYDEQIDPQLLKNQDDLHPEQLIKLANQEVFES